MSTILAVITPARDGGKPVLLVRCAGCAREYQVACDKAQARRAKRCRSCRIELGRPKLSAVEVAAILVDPGRYHDIANRFGIHPHTVYELRRQHREFIER